MPVPKRKTSKSKRDMRRANQKLKAPALATCPDCGEVKQPHHACPSCGSYKGRTVIKVDED